MNKYVLNAWHILDTPVNAKNSCNLVLIPGCGSAFVAEWTVCFIAVFLFSDIKIWNLICTHVINVGKPHYVFILIFLALKLLTICSAPKSLYTDFILSEECCTPKPFTFFSQLAHVSLATNHVECLKVIDFHVFNKPATVILHMLFFAAVLNLTFLEYLLNSNADHQILKLHLCIRQQ